MRTTVTVDPDVEILLREAMRQTGQSFKLTLNQVIRKGLAGVIAEGNDPPYVVGPKAMGTRPGIDPTRLQQLADDLEIDAFVQLTQKLERSRNGRTWKIRGSRS